MLMINPSFYWGKGFFIPLFTMLVLWPDPRYSFLREDVHLNISDLSGGKFQSVLAERELNDAKNLAEYFSFNRNRYISASAHYLKINVVCKTVGTLPKPGPPQSVSSPFRMRSKLNFPSIYLPSSIFSYCHDLLVFFPAG